MPKTLNPQKTTPAAAVTSSTPQGTPVASDADFNTTHTAKALDAWVARYPNSTPQPVAAPVVASTAPAQAPIPVVSNTQPSPVPTASTKKPIVTLAWCNAWLQFTYAHELAELVALGVYVQARAVRAPGEVFGPSTSVLLTVKDGLVGGEAGLDGELTFTFLDADHPKVELTGLNMAQFQDMARRFWQELPIIKDVYQARAGYIAATGANPAETMPDVEDRAGSMQYHWFTGDALPKMDETQNQYPLPKLVALVNEYDERAATYKQPDDAYDDWIDAQAPEIG